MPENSNKTLEALSETRKACSSTINIDPLIKINFEALFLLNSYPSEYQNNLKALNLYMYKSSSLRISHKFYKVSRTKITIYYSYLQKN